MSRETTVGGTAGWSAERNQSCLSCFGKFAHSGSDRSAHLAIGSGLTAKISDVLLSFCRISSAR